MKKFFALLLAMIMVLSMVACGGSKKEEAASDDMKGSVAMVMPGLITDEAFNQYTYEGMVRASEELGMKIAYREEVAQDEQLEVIRQFAQQGYETVIGQGGQFGEALKTAAEEFPEDRKSVV